MIYCNDSFASSHSLTAFYREILSLCFSLSLLDNHVIHEVIVFSIIIVHLCYFFCCSVSFRKPTVTEFLANLNPKSFENCQLLSKSASGQTHVSSLSSAANSSLNQKSTVLGQNQQTSKASGDDRSSMVLGENTSLISLPSSSSSSRPSVSLELHDSKSDVINKKKRKSSKDSGVEYVTVVSSPSTTSTGTNTTTFSPLSTPSSSSIHQNIPQPTTRASVAGVRRKGSFTISRLTETGEQVYENQDDVRRIKRNNSSGGVETTAFPSTTGRSSSSNPTTPLTSSSFFISFPPSRATGSGEEVTQGNPGIDYSLKASSSSHSTHDRHGKQSAFHDQNETRVSVDNNDDGNQISVRRKIPVLKKASGVKTTSSSVSSSFTFYPASSSLGRKPEDALLSSQVKPIIPGKSSSLIRQETFSKSRREPLIQVLESNSSSSCDDSSSTPSDEQQRRLNPSASHQLIDLSDIPSTSRGIRYRVLSNEASAPLEPDAAENFYHELEFDDLDGMDASGLLLLDDSQYLSPPPSYSEVIENTQDYQSPSGDHYSPPNDLNRSGRKGTL